MAKVKDYSQVFSEIYSQLDQQSSALEDYLDTEAVASVVFTVYWNAERQKAVGMDFEDLLSVIASQRRISIIGASHASFYKTDLPIVGYEDLAIDIANIIMVLDAAVDRWRYNVDWMDGV